MSCDTVCPRCGYGPLQDGVPERIRELEAHLESLQNRYAQVTSKCSDAEDKRDWWKRIAEERELLRLRELENAITDIASMAGAPDAVDACRLIVQRCKQAKLATHWRANVDTEYQSNVLISRDELRDLRTATVELRAERDRLREALQAVEDWDLQWADGLDSNVERIKNIVRAALEE